MRFLEILGTFASIISLILSLVDMRKKKFKGSAIVIFIMTLVLAFSFYRYTKLADEKLQKRERYEAAARDAKELLNSVPWIIYESEVGKNTGIVYNTLLYLEKYNDLFSETAKLYKDNVMDKMRKADNETLDYKRKEQIRECAESARQILVLMSNKNEQ